LTNYDWTSPVILQRKYQGAAQLATLAPLQSIGVDNNYSHIFEVFFNVYGILSANTVEYSIIIELNTGSGVAYGCARFRYYSSTQFEMCAGIFVNPSWLMDGWEIVNYGTPLCLAYYVYFVNGTTYKKITEQQADVFNVSGSLRRSGAITSYYESTDMGDAASWQVTVKTHLFTGSGFTYRDSITLGIGPGRVVSNYGAENYCTGTLASCIGDTAVNLQVDGGYAHLQSLGQVLSNFPAGVESWIDGNSTGSAGSCADVSKSTGTNWETQLATLMTNLSTKFMATKTSPSFTVDSNDILGKILATFLNALWTAMDGQFSILFKLLTMPFEKLMLSLGYGVDQFEAGLKAQLYSRFNDMIDWLTRWIVR